MENRMEEMVMLFFSLVFLTEWDIEYENMLAWSLLFLYESQMIFSPLGNICWIHQLIVIYFSCAQVPLFCESHSLLMFRSFNCFVSRRSQFTCIFDRVIVYLNNKQRQLLELMTHLHTTDPAYLCRTIFCEIPCSSVWLRSTLNQSKVESS